ncbi:MAG TPA: Gfo/Idh/MocA family oxidoreductase [Hyphomicrobiales bacterium]|nr:Gfo/Idh/MocA family oxidoreductase [Hyphomicrobiales bacterium]
MEPPLRIGAVGLGRGFMLMLPTFRADPRVQLVAVADPRPEARARFVAEFGGRAYADVAALAADPEVDAVYVATPHQMHAEHVLAAAAAGKHVLVEKPMAVALADAERMVDACRAAGVHLIVGHSHSFDAPIAVTRAMIAGGTYGPLRMMTALNFTDFVYRPRRIEELDSAEGGGVLFSQGAHQVDIVRLLAGGMAQTVRAIVGDWDDSRRTEGAYAALITFAGGITASLTYSGYGHFDTDEFCGWSGETGSPRDPDEYGLARRRLAAAADPAAEVRLKETRAYGAGAAGPGAGAEPKLHEHFGLLLASCGKADLRPLPTGVMIYGDRERALHPLPAPAVPRAEVVDELYAAVVHGTPPVHSGAWGLATLEVCTAMLRSAREGREIALERQVPVAGAG